MINEPRPNFVRCIVKDHGNPATGELSLTWCGYGWRPPVTSAFQNVDEVLHPRHRTILRVCPECTLELIEALKNKTWLVP